MFGLESDKTKKRAEFTFDLEKKIKNPIEKREIKNKIEQRLQRIKTLMREGGSKEDMDQLELILQGYASLIKVIERIPSK